MKKAVLAMLLFTAASTAYAEDIGIIRVESTTIDDRFEAKRDEPSNIAVIGGDEVDTSHTENIQQLLQSIPGITTEVQSGDSIKIHIRGVENQRYMGEKPGVAVVVDGVPVFERTGRVNIDLDNIESIKVVKGGASYLFGEDALSGAVIITTKRGAKMAGYRLAGEAGSHGYKKGVARAGIATEKLNGHIQASRRQSDGYHFQSDYKADYLNGKLQYYLSGSSDLTFGFELSNRNKDSHGTVTGVTQAINDPKSVDGRDYARMYDVRLYKYFLTYAGDFGTASNLMLNGYQFGDNTGFSSAPQKYDSSGNAVTDVDAYTTGNDYKQVQRGVKGEWRSGGEKLAYLAAIDLRRNEYRNRTSYLVDFKTSPRSRTVYTAGTVTGDDRTNEDMNAAYGEVKVSPWKKFVVTANGRLDQITMNYTDNLNPLSLSKTFNVDSWRLGANYNMADRWDMYGNISTGFRTPTVDQLFAGDISPFGDTASNRDLKPERSLNIELGTRGKTDVMGLPLDMDAAIFQIDRKDFILSSVGQYSVPESGELGQYRNIGGVQNRGLELMVNSDQSRTFSFDLAYTWLDAKFTKYENFGLILGNRYSNPTLVTYNNTGRLVPRTPTHHLNLTGRVKPAKGVTVALEMDAISSYYADEINQTSVAGHAVFNLLANYDVKWKDISWSLFARVDNFLDRRYYTTVRGHSDSNTDGVYNQEDISITVNPGLVWTAGISAEF